MADPTVKRSQEDTEPPRTKNIIGNTNRFPQFVGIIIVCIAVGVGSYYMPSYLEKGPASGMKVHSDIRCF